MTSAFYIQWEHERLSGSRWQSPLHRNNSTENSLDNHVDFVGYPPDRGNQDPNRRKPRS